MIFRDALEAFADDDMKAMLRRMTFSNAYISEERARLLPLPLCMSLVKLDKKRLHYRLSPGKDPSRVEQDVGVGDAYARSFENRLTIYTKPETERIASRGGKIADTGRLPRKLTIMNRFRYSECDTLTLDNYRIGCKQDR